LFDTNLINIPEVAQGLTENSGTNFYTGTEPNVANILDTWFELDTWATPNAFGIDFPGLIIGHTYQFQALLGFGWSYSAFNLNGVFGEYAYFSDDDTADDGSIGMATYTWTATGTNATINLGVNYPNSGTSQVMVFGYALTDVPTLQIQQSGKGYDVLWPYGTLLQANSVNGPYTPVPSAAPPSFVIPLNGTQKFYRVQVSP
jgi:hypothetical protein